MLIMLLFCWDVEDFLELRLLIVLNAQYRMTFCATHLLLFKTLNRHHRCAPLANSLLMMQWRQRHSNLGVHFSLA